MSELTHTDHEGNARMVDVGHKADQHRTAVARGFIRLQAETITLIRENNMKKGDVLTVAKIAGIHAAKKASDLIPLCHPLPLNNINVELELTNQGIEATSTVSCTGKTGVEMEAIMAASNALITVYDMCKAVDKNMVIEKIQLISKEKKDI